METKKMTSKSKDRKGSYVGISPNAFNGRTVPKQKSQKVMWTRKVRENLDSKIVRACNKGRKDSNVDMVKALFN